MSRIRFHLPCGKWFRSSCPSSLVSPATLLLISCFSLLFINVFASPQLASGSAANPFELLKEGAIINDGGISRGVAWGDYDADGFPDLFVANTSNQRSFLYRNKGDGTFARVTDWAGANLTASSEGAAWADYDNDGDLDLFVANRDDHANFLFRNNGNGSFTRVIDSALVSDKGNSTGSCWADVDRDGDLDLFVARRDKQNNLLFSNNGNGTFKKITEGAIVNDGGDSRTCGWADADLDGDPDLFVGNAHEQSFYYRNDGNWRFTRLTSGPFVTNRGYTYGTSWADYDNDGDFDLFVAHVLQPNLLYTNDGKSHFSSANGMKLSNDIGASKGNAWGDYDNDGDLDLVVANGTPGRQNYDFLYRNEGRGVFTRPTEGAIVSDDYVSAGTAWADYDNDGDLDLFVANWGDGEKGENNLFYVNKRSAGGWVIIKTVGVRSNRFGVGARVRLVSTIKGKTTVQTQQVSGQTGYGSQSDLRLHFGLGDASRVDSLELFWPSGRIDRYSKLPINTIFIATEGKGITPAHGKQFMRRAGREPVSNGTSGTASY